MQNIIIEDIVDNGRGIEEIIEDAQGDEVDIFEYKEADECRLFNNGSKYIGDNVIRKRNMSLFEENVDRDENDKEGWSNPTLSNNRELDDEAINYRSIMKNLDEAESGSEEEKRLEDELNMSFKRIAGYYSNYEYRWFEKMGHLFEEPILFYDFFYDLLRECLDQFNPNNKSDKVYENDYRKAKVGAHFNQYFYGALSKRKITSLKKTMNTANHPSILCHICGDEVTRITEFHLRHQYDESRIRKDFKVVPEKIDGNRVFAKCPICGAEKVPVSHVKEHNYAEQIDVKDYIERFPHVQLAGSIRSLQEPLTTSSDGDNITYEDVYHTTETDNNQDLNISMFSSHIDNVLKDDPFTAEILKLKMMDYKDKEIAELIGETCVIELEYDITKNITKKSELFKHIKDNSPNHDFFNKYEKKFYIVNREHCDDLEVFYISSCAPFQVDSAIKKLRKNSRKIKELFGNSNFLNV